MEPGEARVAVLGGGTIGSAIALSLRGHVASLTVTARSRETLERLRGLGLEATSCNPCAVRDSDVVFIAVKPYQFPALAGEIAGEAEGKTVVSVMAAVPVEALRAALPGAEVHRAMPNLNIRLGRSLTALYSPPGSRNTGLVKKLLSYMGRVYELPEELMDAWTAFAGSGPGLVAEFVDALFLAALSVGIPRDVARRVAVELLEDTAAYLSSMGRGGPLHQALLRDEVTTPAGTTIAAIRVLEGRGFKSAVIDAVIDATRRASQLASEIKRSLAPRG